ncbi:Type IV secretory pathway, VirJ component [Bartonella apihabitans]|uniref:Type IV secretory pathway, VirJ component n=1 Tax=Bartonella apihabitans TaxID=2750929 RepID=A0A1U9MBN4_9HYPH|nr:Type IV secretory pathway, VirJ component [Bartonella apihabitans]
MTIRRIILLVLAVFIIAAAAYGVLHRGKINRLWASFIGSTSPVVYAEGERFTDIPVYLPQGDIRGLVILVSDTGGPKTRETDMTAALLKRNLIVASVNFDNWREELDKEDGDCVYLVSDLEALSKDILRRLDLDVYFHPVVVGIGEGGTVSYAAAADSPENTLAGTVVLDPSQSSHTRLPSCTEEADATKMPDGGYSYETGVKVPSPVTIISNSLAGNDVKQAARDKVAAIIKDPAFESRMKETVDTALDYAIRDAADADLPIIDMPSKNPAKALVIFFSGDGGWRDIDMEIGDLLQSQDIHVIGIDSLRYFWSTRTPEEIAKDIEQLVQEADPEQRLPVALFGYSFGADVLPFAWEVLDETVKDQTVMIALMGLSKTADFQISIDGWLGGSGDTPVLDQMQYVPADKRSVSMGRTKMILLVQILRLMQQNV